MTKLAVGLLYALIGIGTAVLGGNGASSGRLHLWRLAAWLLSLTVFALHLGHERLRLRHAPAPAARHAAAAVAFGAFLLAAMGPVRTHWGTDDFGRIVVLSLVLWPLLTGVPAFLVAFLAGTLFVRHAPKQP